MDVWAVILMIYNLSGPSFGIPPQDADILIPVFVPLTTLGPIAFLVAIGWWIMLLIQKLRSQRAQPIRRPGRPSFRSTFHEARHDAAR